MEYLIAAVIGAVIGYITNWLAIKMLFRPHHEKRIMGMKVPFTPGLIPKERGRIARSVGETIGTHLLTKESIVDALCGGRISTELEGWIEKKVSGEINSDTSLGQKIAAFSGENYEKLINDIKSRITQTAIRGLGGEGLRAKISGAVMNYLKGIFKTSPSGIMENDYYRGIRETLINRLIVFKDSEEFREVLKEYIRSNLNRLEKSDGSIEETLPGFIQASLKVYIYNSRREICEAIKEMMKEPDIEQRIKQVVGNMIGTSLSPLVAMFISTDMVYGKINSAVEEYFKEDENQRNTALLINKGFDRIMKNKISELLTGINKTEMDDNIKALADMIVKDILTEQFIAHLCYEMERKLVNFKTLEELLTYLDPDYMNKIEKLINEEIIRITEGSGFQGQVDALAGELLHGMLDTPVSKIAGSSGSIITEGAVRITGEAFDNFVKNEAAGIIELLNIPQIVEDRINDFEVEVAEKIILDISRNELSAITWLGALLGAIIGILSPLLQRLY